MFFAVRRFILAFEGVLLLREITDLDILLTLQLVIAIMVVVGLVLSLAIYSVILLRRSFLAKVGCMMMMVAFLFDLSSFFPIETALGVLSFFVLTQQDVKEAYAQKEGKLVGGLRGKNEEVVFEADTTAIKAKRRYGFKCPKCGMRLPPSAEVCRRCGTRIPDDYP